MITVYLMDVATGKEFSKIFYDDIDAKKFLNKVKYSKKLFVMAVFGM